MAEKAPRRGARSLWHGALTRLEYITACQGYPEKQVANIGVNGR